MVFADTMPPAEMAQLHHAMAECIGICCDEMDELEDEDDDGEKWKLRSGEQN